MQSSEVISRRYFKRKLVLITCAISLMVHVFYGKRTTKKIVNFQFKQLPLYQPFVFHEYVEKPNIKYPHEVLSSTPGVAGVDRSPWIPAKLKVIESNLQPETQSINSEGVIQQRINFLKNNYSTEVLTKEGGNSKSIENVSHSQTDEEVEITGAKPKSAILTSEEISKLPFDKQFKELIRTLADRHKGIDTHVEFLIGEESYTQMSRRNAFLNWLLKMFLDWKPWEKSDKLQLGLKYVLGETLYDLLVNVLSKVCNFLCVVGDGLIKGYRSVKEIYHLASGLHQNRANIAQYKKDKAFSDSNANSFSNLVVELYTNFLNGDYFIKENFNLCKNYFFTKSIEMCSDSKNRILEIKSNCVGYIKNKFSNSSLVNTCKNSRLAKMFYKSDTEGSHELENDEQPQAISKFKNGINKLLELEKYIVEKLWNLIFKSEKKKKTLTNEPMPSNIDLVITKETSKEFSTFVNPEESIFCKAKQFFKNLINKIYLYCQGKNTNTEHYLINEGLLNINNLGDTYNDQVNQRLVITEIED